MNTAKLITRAYFLGALAGSAAHIITSAHKMGGEGVEAYATPFMIDGIAILGMHMRNEKYDERTNKIGFRVQCGSGAMSLAMNVYAAHNLFGILFGIAIVALFILSEWMSDNITLRADANAADAIKAAEQAVAWLAACTHPTTCNSETQCTTKTAAAVKRSKTVAKKMAAKKVLATV